MFEIVERRQRQTRPTGAIASAALHIALVAVFVWLAQPTYVRVNSVKHGNPLSTVSVVYWPSSFALAPTSTHNNSTALTALQLRSRNSQLRFKAQLRRARAEELSRAAQSVARRDRNSQPDPALAAGSLYGSSSFSDATGADVRPALWLSGVDPSLPTSAVAGVDDTIVVEITIDSHGNIVSKTVLHSLGPLIDGTVLDALASWHFLPARRDGQPIASKQDVHFHFGGKQGS